MEELIKLLTEKTGLPEDKARIAAETVLGFVKQRLPASVGEQLNSLLAIPAGPGFAERVKGMAGSVSSVFTRKTN